LPHARDLIRDGKEFKGRRLPSQGQPNSVLYKRDPQTGQITNYTVYDDAGNAIKRVDLTGRSHGGVPTPHMVEYTVHRHPQTGQVFVRENRMVRPARPEETP
jgi:Bacterial toxin 24